MQRSRRVRIRWPVLATGVVALALASPLPGSASSDGERVIDERMHHLGNDKTPKWSEAPPDPEPSPLQIEFQAVVNAKEWVLEATARDVDDDWTLELNGVRLGLLKRHDAELLTSRYVVPARTLTAGRNVLKLTGRNPDEDITVGRFKLYEKTLRELARLGRVDVEVKDGADGSPLPARITVVDAGGNKVELFYVEARTTAVRPGIAYTSDGKAALEIPEGRYTIWASRGMEWSCAKSDVDVAFGSKGKVSFALTREVDTAGWVAADTHIHTLTHSGHGDSSVEERVVTIAGEGIELPIATDHNHQTDYRPFQKEIGLTRWFTPVVGNEVTTDNGHMNAFPLPPGGEVPPYKKITDWATLVEGIRAKGAKVVILNHPRWPEDAKDPLTSFGFDERSGERRTGAQFTFDGFELVNSDCPTASWEVVLPCWYALLNRGERFTGVGSSDSHTVGVIVGQGRTYVPSRTDDPAEIDVDDACKQFKEGRVTVSFGLFVTIAIGGRGMGDTLPVAGDEVEATVDVRHPSWVTPEKVELIVDGAVVASEPLTAAAQGPMRLRAKLPAHDCWIVAVATGAKVTAPFWAMELPKAVAITNPIFLERDQLAGWSSPRATAQRRLATKERVTSLAGAARATAIADRLRQELPQVDDAVAIQMLELARDELRASGQETLLADVVTPIVADRPMLHDWTRSQIAPH